MKRAHSEESVDSENTFNVCEVNKWNLSVVANLVRSAAASCDYVALDTEFSGLESGDAFRSHELNVRYAALRAMVDRYALLQFGLSFVRKSVEGGGGPWKSLSFTFHVVRSTPFSVLPASMVFLAEHGLSLTDVFKRGIPFTPPSSEEPCKDDKLALLLRAVAANRKPLIVHNGIHDLLFLYRSFFGVLPATSAEWIAAMTTEFPVVFDTKHICATVAGEEATYLQYLFRTALHCQPSLFDCAAVPLEYQIVADASSAAVPTVVCDQFARHGNCRNGTSCPFSHDVDYIVHVEQAKKRGGAVTLASRSNSASQRNLQRPHLSHSAGFDAFATAFVFASYWKKLGDDAIRNNANHIYLMYAARPLLLIPSQYG